MAKTITSVGIEYDSLGIRAAKIAAEITDRGPEYNVESLQEIRGTFSKDEDIIAGLKEIKSKVGISMHDKIVTCVAGKQIYAAQMPFRRMAPDEMKNGLRFEIRKNLPFEAAGATIDFQVLPDQPAEREDEQTLLVSAVANILLNKQLRLIQKVGLKPWIVDVLPVAVANAYWAAESNPTNIEANLILHISPEVCTVVIDGNGAPFYTRSIYFSAEDLFGESAAQVEHPMSERERSRRTNVLGDELRRSLSFYEKNYGVSTFGSIYMIGEYLYSKDLYALLDDKLGMKTENSTLLQRLNVGAEILPGKYDVALGMAMRIE